MAAQIVQVLIEIGHRAWYRKKVTPDRTHDWILFVRGSEGNDLSHFVEKIVFNLHESFNPSRRVYKSAPYELRESGYGEFMPMIDIYFKNKGEKGAQRKVTIQYYLNLNREDSPPIDNVRPEKLKFYNPAEEFLEKVLKAGGVILGSDGCPLPSKPRPSTIDLQLNPLHLAFDSRHHHDASSDFLVDVDSAAKSASQLAKKKNRSTEANPMSNDSNSSNESIISRRSSKSSDPIEKDSDPRGTKRRNHSALFEHEESKKKQAALEKPDSRSGEQRKPGKDDKGRSSKDEGHRPRSSSSHHRRVEGSRHAHEHSHSKPKSGSDRNSRSRTPSKAKSSESSGGARVHGGSSKSTHHHGSSGSSHHHGSSSKSSKVEGSRHSGGGQSQKTGSSSSTHHGSSSKHRTSGDGGGLSRKIQDVRVQLSPVDSQIILNSSNPRSGRKAERSSDGFSSRKPDHPSPVKRRPRPLASPLAGCPPPTFDPSAKTYDDPFASSTNRVRPKYDKLLDDMKSDDEEEDGEIRSPVATEVVPDPAPAWREEGNNSRKEEKAKESSLERKKSSSRSKESSAAATPRLEKPERPAFGAEKASPTKARSDWSSEKTSPEEDSVSSFSRTSQVKAKKSQARENVDGEPRSSKRPSSVSKSGLKDSSQQRPSSSSLSSKQQATKGPSPGEAVTVKSEAEEKDAGLFKVDPTQWENNYRTIKTKELKEERMEVNGLKNDSTPYEDNDDEKKPKTVKTKSEPTKGATTTYSDRAPNGERLVLLVELKEKINRMTSAALLNRIVDVIQAAGKLKSDDEALEFDFCQLDPETMQRVKQILETVSD